jgi:hypothetical protein
MSKIMISELILFNTKVEEWKNFPLCEITILVSLWFFAGLLHLASSQGWDLGLDLVIF